jgi:hypothetical protein
VADVVERDLHSLLKEIPQMSKDERKDSDNVLEQLQDAVRQQELILARQAELIERLRRELKDVNRD